MAIISRGSEARQNVSQSPPLRFQQFRVLSPLPPGGPYGSRDLRSDVAATLALEDLEEFVIFDSVAQPFEAHRGYHALHSDGLPRVEKQTLSWIIITSRPESLHVRPRII